MNSAILIGRLTRDPEMRFLPSGNNTAVTRFTLAVDRQLSKDKKAEFESRNLPTTDFISITVWGKQAEHCANYLSKGRLVAVCGRIQTGSYEAKDGIRRYTTEVVAERVQFLERDNNNSHPATSSGYDGGDSGSDDFSDIDGFYTVSNEDIPF